MKSKETNNSLACARCTKHVDADALRKKIGRFTYCTSCAKIMEAK